MGGGGSNKIKETPQEKALADVAMERFERYNSKFKDFEDKFIADVTGGTAIQERRVAGQVNADIAQNTATSLPPGMDPSSGRAGAIEQAASTGRAAAGAQVGANMGVKDQKTRGIQAAIDIGRGEATEAQIGLEQIAGRSVGRAINDEAMAFNRRSSNLDAVGSAIGTAGAIGMNYNRGLSKMTDAQGGQYLTNSQGVRVKSPTW